MFARVYELLGGWVRVELLARDGESVQKGGKNLAVVRGDMRAILTGERTALNFLQRMSGIATYTAKMAELLAGSGLRLVDTARPLRICACLKNTPCARAGAATTATTCPTPSCSKNNHIGAAGGVRAAVQAAKAHAPFTAKIEVEAESVDMALEAVEAARTSSCWTT